VNIRHIKKALVGLNIILTGSILYFGTLIFQEWKSENRTRQGPDFYATQNRKTRTSTPGTATRLAAYQTIIRHDIFDTTRLSAQQKPVEETDPENIAPTQLRLQLNGTVVADQYAYAVITDVLTNQEGIYTVNDTVQNATIALIQTDRIVLNVGGRKEALVLFPEEKDPKAPVIRPGYQAVPGRRPPVSRQLPSLRQPGFRLPSK